MDIVTPAASISFFRPEFDDFLHAPIGTEQNEMPLSVLSALARSDVDPWEEAAELSELPKDTAMQRLALLIARLPGERWTQADSRAIATRLIELLPRRFSSKVALAEEARGVRGMTGRAAAKILICTALAVIALIMATSPEPSSRGDKADAPTVTDYPPQKTPPPPSSRQ